MAIERCLNLELRKANRLMTQFYEARLAEYGLKSGQFSILRAVHFLKATNNKQLQSALVIDQTTLSRNLKPLIRDGLLTLASDPDDQRVKVVSLSEAGKALYLEALKGWEQAQQDIKQKLGVDDAEQILNLTRSVVKAFSVS